MDRCSWNALTAEPAAGQSVLVGKSFMKAPVRFKAALRFAMWLAVGCCLVLAPLRNANAHTPALNQENTVSTPELTLEPPDEPAPGEAPEELFEGGVPRLVRDAGVKLTYLPGGGSDGLGITDVSTQVSVIAPMPFQNLKFLVLTPAFGLRSLDAPTALGLKSELYSATLTATWLHDWSDRTKLVVGVTGGVYSDFETSASGFRLTGHGFATTQLNDRWELMLGAIALNQNGLPVVPAGGLIYKPNTDTRIEITAPRPRIARRIHWFGTTVPVEDWVYLAGEFGGGRFAVQRPSGADDFVNFRDFRVIAGFESKRTDGISSLFEVGYVFGRSVTFDDDPAEFKPSGTVMVRAGLSF
ncbi:MAG: DUF6268 family outer membrane beta-barrel protein [Planctomycetaceae bacterium]